MWYNSSVAASVMSLPVEASPLSSIAIFDFTLLLVVTGARRFCCSIFNGISMQINCKQEAIQINCQVDIHIMMKRTKEHKK